MEKSRQGKLKLRWQKHKKLKAWNRSANKPEKRCQSAARMCGRHPGQPSDRWKWQWWHLLLCKFQADFAGHFGRECWFAQKRNRNKTMFVHTYFRSYAIIIDVTPPIHYIVFATPHKKKYLLQKRQPIPLSFLFCKNNHNRDGISVVFILYFYEFSTRIDICLRIRGL